MTNEPKKVRFIFTPKTISAITETISAFGLKDIDAKTKISLLARDTAKQNITSKEAVDFLQKTFGISLQVAEKIIKQIEEGVVPYFEKVEEEKLNNPAFVNELAEKIWGAAPRIKNERLILTKENTPTGITNIDTTDIDFIRAPEAKPLPQQTKTPDVPKKPVPSQESFVPPAPKQNKHIGKDTYREPIE